MLPPSLAGLLAKEHQEELLRTARDRTIELGFAQDEEEELLALDNEYKLSLQSADSEEADAATSEREPAASFR